MPFNIIQSHFLFMVNGASRSLGPTEEGERKSHGDLDGCGAHGKPCPAKRATGESGDKTYRHSLHLGAKGEKG